MIPVVRGTRDILPVEIRHWQKVEAIARNVCERYGYAELRTPLIEREELFTKGTGESTDIVQKEMYTFTDKGGERVTLRPEATPSMVRAFVEHGLEQVLAISKLYCLGPMFRYERPQKGRYRQFHQLNVEAFGIKDPAIDAEIIEMAYRLVSELSIEGSEIVINSVGCGACRREFTQALQVSLGEDRSKLCSDCQRRAEVNPLRIFDCKVKEDQPIIDALPRSIDYLCSPCREHFETVQQHLHAYGLAYRVSHRLVRGLDYYTRTTFEVLSTKIGSQNAILGGGRYDGLVKLLGGPDRVGIGFAAGIERLVLALPEESVKPQIMKVFVMAIGDTARISTQLLARDLREAGLYAEIDYEGHSVKSQMKRADKLNVSKVLIVGDDELARNEVTVKDMSTGNQRTIARARIVQELRKNGSLEV